MERKDRWEWRLPDARNLLRLFPLHLRGDFQAQRVEPDKPVVWSVVGFGRVGFHHGIANGINTAI